MENRLRPANTAAIQLTAGGEGMAARYAMQARRSAERAELAQAKLLNALERLRAAFEHGGNQEAASVLDELILDLSSLG